VQEDNVQATIDSLRNPPAMVVTDSQAFASVQKDVPDSIPLTSFSILMARYKGFLETAALGAAHIDQLRDGDRVLIAEGCTHHRQCDDIGTVKIPRWLQARTGKKLTIETSSGTGFPDDLTPFALVIHCGGCMLNAREMQSRIGRAVSQGVPVTNYGTAIAYMNGILRRSISMFPDLVRRMDEIGDKSR
jgi:[FeFe] hydrogenase H-cluster maturation GTPase HydF